MADHISELIGETPLVLLDALSQETGLRVLAKYEAANPGASIKDRAARSMIDRAEERGEIAPGLTVLVEPTSGNTGVAVAMIGAARGYEVVIAMPESMSRERRALMAAYGARLELTPAAAGMAGAVARAEEIAREVPGAWIVGQFTNPDNPRAHEETTGPEIVRQLGGFPDYVVAGVGTGGTLSGVAHYLRAQGAPTKFYAVEPAESPLVSQALAGEELAVDIVGACASQEEVGVRGATVTAQVVQPDLAIVFEGCPADDTCVESYMVQTAIKRGPMLRHIDARMITNPRYQRYALDLAEKLGIPVQDAVRAAGSTNGAAIHLTGRGVPVIVIGVPVRYAHTHYGVSAYADFDNAVKLACEILKRADADLIESF